MRAGLNKEVVTAAAIDEVDRNGLDQLTLSGLARGFGVKVASLYAHVAGIEDLRTRVAAYALDEMATAVAASLAGRSGREALLAYAQTYRDYARAHPGRYAAARRRVEIGSLAAPAALRHRELAVAVLSAYDLPRGEEVHAIRFLGAAIHGFNDLENSGSYDHSGSLEPSWMRMVGALDRALRTWPTAQQTHAQP